MTGRCYDAREMNLLAIIIVFLAIVTAGAIAYIAWELSSGDPAGGAATRESKASSDPANRSADEPPGA